MKKAIFLCTAAFLLSVTGVSHQAQAAVSASKQRAAEVKAIVDTVEKNYLNTRSIR